MKTFVMAGFISSLAIGNATTTHKGGHFTARRNLSVLAAILLGLSVQAYAGAINLFPASVNGLQVDVNGSASDTDKILRLSWNWGDGQQTAGLFPQEHTYSAQGQYNIQVEAQYQGGGIASASQKVAVGPGIVRNVSATATAPAYNGIPGGVVFSNGYDAILFDFTLKQNFNLTAGNHPAYKKVAINEQGDSLAVLAGNRFSKKNLAAGDWFTFGALVQSIVQRQGMGEFVWINKLDPTGQKSPREIQESLKEAIAKESYPEKAVNLSISAICSHGNFCIACEYPTKGDKFTQVSRDSAEYTKGVPPGIIENEKKEEQENSNAFLTKKDYPRYIIGQVDFTRVDIVQRLNNTNVEPEYVSSFGNGEKQPRGPCCYRLPSGIEWGWGATVYPEGPYHINNATYTREQMIQRDEQIRAMGAYDARFPAWSNQLVGIHTQHPRVAFVYHQQSTNKWGPIIVQGAFDSSDFKEIPVDLADCRGLAWKQDGTTLTYATGNSVCSVDGGVLANGVSLTKYFWVADDAFIFRSPEGALLLWKAGRTEKLLDTIPEEFTYCVRNPVAKIWAGRDKVDIWRPIDSGSFSTYWDPEPCFENNLIAGKTQGVTLVPQDDVWFAISKETDLQKINPSSLQYANRPKEAREIALNEVIILKAHNQFLAIKPVEIFAGEKKPTGNNHYTWVGSYMTYEWRLWR